MTSLIKYDILFDIGFGVKCAIYTNGDYPSFDMEFNSILDVELWIANIQRELVIAQLRGNENSAITQRIKELQERIAKEPK